MGLRLILALLIFLLVLGGTFFVRVGQENYFGEDDLPITESTNLSNTIIPLDNQTSTNMPSNVTSPADSGKISTTVLTEHNSAQDCWIAHGGNVYDVTSYLDRHPGGASKISRYCGTSDEFEQAFTRQHGTSKAGLLVKVAIFIGDFDSMGALGA